MAKVLGHHPTFRNPDWTIPLEMGNDHPDDCRSSRWRRFQLWYVPPTIDPGSLAL